MAKSDRSFIPYAVLFVLGAIIIALLLYIVPFRYGLNAEVRYEPGDMELNNPLTGYAPWGTNEEECLDSQLVFIQVLWSEWEPSQDNYDISALEDKYHIRRWKSMHKNAVLRFVCDVPGDARHMDIPTWLYAQTGDGAYYDGIYGQGYCPDYDNRLFRERHALAIQALANYCNQDDFVAYVELGSLGHWGEWHTDESGGALPLPDAAVCNEYVLDYSNSFHNARLLTRRNYSIAVEGGLGFYNDMIGDQESTEEWLDWLRDGGTYETQGEALKLLPVEHFWDTAPVGGEMTSSISKEELFSRWFSDVEEEVERTHLTFIGPNCPNPAEDQSDEENVEELRERLGYRYYISSFKSEYSFSKGVLVADITWENAGLAPCYWNWPVTMYVYDKSGKRIYWDTVDIDLRELLPDEQVETRTEIPFTDELRQGFQVGIGICSPDQTRHIRLAMDVDEGEDDQIIYTFEP